jgi:cell division protein ZapD
VILYEYPLEERIRTYLRLEHLFARLRVLVAREHAIDHHVALTTMFEVMDVASRGDLKSDALKDLERHRQLLHSYRGNPAISEAALDQIVGRVDACFKALNDQEGKAGLALTDHEWLMSIRSRASIPGGTCGFDLPAYFAWQHLGVGRRQTDLAQWAQTFAPLADSVALLLGMLRDSGVAQKVVAEGGQFQQRVPNGKVYTLLRMRIDDSTGLIPEISANKLMVSVRLMRQGQDERLHAAAETSSFELALCA